MLDFLFEILGEFVLQLALEVLAEVGLRALGAPFQKAPNPWLAGIGYSVFGAAAGGLSLWLVSSHLVKSQSLRVLNLILTPIAVGVLMAAIGTWRSHRAQRVLRIDRFACGYLFAFLLALTRFVFAK
ncbi:MAG: hypothetical protein HY299_18910 [Verrucomicrobia bacterium]|nr:hypothetical protein [Verrucomicrobiota bacterium]